jgi:hypothetical protein
MGARKSFQVNAVGIFVVCRLVYCCLSNSETYAMLVGLVLMLVKVCVCCVPVFATARQ